VCEVPATADGEFMLAVIGGGRDLLFSLGRALS